MLTFPLSPGVHIDEPPAVSFGIEQAPTAVPVFVVGPSDNDEQAWWKTAQSPVIVRTFGEYENWMRGWTGSYSSGPAFGSEGYTVVSASRRRVTPWPAHWPTLSRMGGRSEKEPIDWSRPLAPALKAYFDNGGSYCYLCPSDKLDVIADMSDVTLIVQAGQPTDVVASTMLRLCQPGSGVFALLDGPQMEGRFDGATLDDHLAALSPSECAALYFPWLTADWPLRDSKGRRIRGKDIHPVAPSAVAAGLICRTDRNIGPWKAPANVAVSPGLMPQVRVGDNSQARYTSENFGTMSVNMFREFSGRGVQLWGARTLTTSGNAWGYIPVRRTFDMVERSLQRSLEVALFEPNSAATWQQLRASAGGYLYNLMQRGAFAGRTEAESYYVEVGVGSTMSQAEVDAGIARMRIGMAVVRPAEFVVLEFGQGWTRADGGQGGVPVPPPVEQKKRFVLAEQQLPAFPKDIGGVISLSRDGATLAVAGNRKYSGLVVYVFSRLPQGNWEQTHYSGVTGDYRKVLCLNDTGDVLLVGSRFDAGESGRVYALQKGSDGVWKTHIINNSGAVMYQKFGLSLAFAGLRNCLVVRAGGYASRQKPAYYILNDYLDYLDDKNASDERVEVIDLNNIAINFEGNVLMTSSSDGDGVVTCYMLKDNKWNKLGELHPDFPKGAFGAAMSLNDRGDILAVSAHAENKSSGAVYIYQRTNNDWSKIAHLKPEMEGEQFGLRVALSGDGKTLVVSSPYGKNSEGETTGAVWWYTDGWQLQEKLLAENDAVGKGFGVEIALSSDGEFLVVGADAGEEEGQVYIYGKK